MINQEVKGTLAKLLATENLTVEHRKISTASFDVERRVLILPIWKAASATVYDLLVGHEVGHALYTPNEDIRGVSKAFVNVLEDARIEKMMKQTYPGLRKSFYQGYQELWDMDFFGVKDEDPATLSLIDRINLYFKGNPSIPFSNDEMVWVRRADQTKSFQDVLDLARELWEYANQKQEEKEMEAMPMSQNGQKQADSYEEVSGDSSSKEKEWPTDSDPEDDHRNDREFDSDDADLEVPSYVGGDTTMDETESITDAALQEALETMVDEDAKEWVYLTLPDVKASDYIITAETVQNDLEEHYYNREFENDDQKGYYFDNIEYAINHYNNFKKDTQKTVNYLCKQFEMKKSADEYKRAATSKTGVLDTNKLHQYKLTEDIFKKVTIIPEGKNHGLVMFVDWSGSMQHQLLETIRQTYNLVWFCKKSGIPFRVYAFQSGLSYGDKDEISQSEGELCIRSDFNLLELASSKQNAKSLEKSLRLVYLQVFAMGGYRLSYAMKYTLGGTPLGESMLLARSIVASMKRTEHVTKVNVICLTDGESNPMSYVTTYTDFYSKETNLRQDYLCHNRNKVFILRDSVTGYSRRLKTSPHHTTKEIVSYMREITDYNWIGIRICTKSEASRMIREYAYEEYQVCEKQWTKERFTSIKQKAGFTEAFFIPQTNTVMSTQDIQVKQKKEVATKAELTRAFKKHMGSKMANKTILNAFIDNIA